MHRPIDYTVNWRGKAATSPRNAVILYKPYKSQTKFVQNSKLECTHTNK